MPNNFNGRERQANISANVGYCHANKGLKTKHSRYYMYPGRKISLLSNFRHFYSFYIMLLICLQSYVIFIFRIHGEKLLLLERLLVFQHLHSAQLWPSMMDTGL